MRPHELVIHSKYAHDDVTVWEVDVKKSVWFGEPIQTLGAYGRRKFENWIILEHPKERIKVIYR